MRRCAAIVTALVQLALAPETRTVFAMKTGILLRMHVIAQDDTPAMQAVKYAVRDAVQEAYAASARDDRTMLQNAQDCLSDLTEAATASAKAAGFTGEVTVSLTHADFDQRQLDGLTIPAGNYPALLIRLGEARGHNWWGLIDRELSLRCAAVGPAEGESVVWDWSAAGFWDALKQLFLPAEVTP